MEKPQTAITTCVVYSPSALSGGGGASASTASPHQRPFTVSLPFIRINYETFSSVAQHWPAQTTLFYSKLKLGRLLADYLWRDLIADVPYPIDNYSYWS
ncbi:hypothetical protein EJB05_20155, partial [Eragrostis curvula]